MGAEGGGRWEGNVLGRMALGGSPERGIEQASWLSRIINPEKLKRFRDYPAFEGRSTEWIIMDVLLATIVEKGPEMDPIIRARLSNLIGILRATFYPNMNQREQELIHDLVTKTTTVDFSALQYDITPEISEDTQWIWRTFGLEVPGGDQLQELPEGLQSTLRSLPPQTAKE